MTNRELDTFEIVGQPIEKDRFQGFVDTGRQKIMAQVLEQARPKLNGFGIELVDVKMKRLNYVQEVQKSVYGRMIAEREQIAQKFISEGKGQAREIEGNQERDLKRITSEAYRKAQEIKGKADAESTQIYAEAFGRDPEFYSFLRTLEIYRETMKKDSSLVLSTDSDFLKYFKELE
jgi:membrane protease subunit HflC